MLVRNFEGASSDQCVIYGEVRGVPVPPLFILRGTAPLTFHGEKVKNLLSPAVNRDDLWRLNYNKLVSGGVSAPDSAGRAHVDRATTNQQG